MEENSFSFLEMSNYIRNKIFNLNKRHKLLFPKHDIAPIPIFMSTLLQYLILDERNGK